MLMMGSASNGMPGKSNTNGSKPGSNTEDGLIEVWANNMEVT